MMEHVSTMSGKVNQQEGTRYQDVGNRDSNSKPYKDIVSLMGRKTKMTIWSRKAEIVEG